MSCSPAVDLHSVYYVKKATFHIIGSGRKGRTENRWDVSGAGQSASPEVYLIYPR